MRIPLCTGTTVHVKASEDNLEESVLSFHLMGPGHQTEAVPLGCTCLSLMSHFTSPRILSLKNVKNISIHNIHLCCVAKEDVRGADDEDLSMNCELLTLETKDICYCALVVCLKSSMVKMGACLTLYLIRNITGLLRVLT